MKVFAILAIALLIGSMGFVTAQYGKQVEASSAGSIDASAVVNSPSFGTASNGNAVASTKRISPSAVEGRAVSAESVVAATPKISPVRVEEAYSAVGVKAQNDFPNKKEFGFAVATSGPGNAVSSQGVTKQIQLVLVSQQYVNADGSEPVTVEEGTVVVADETYSLKLEEVKAGMKTYSVIKAGVAVGQLEAQEAEADKLTGSLNIDGEAYEIEVLTEENPVRLETEAAEARAIQETGFVNRVRSFFSNLFSFGRR